MLLRYIEGRAADVECEAVRHWCAASAANRASLARLERAWALVGELPQVGFDPDALWDRIRRRLDGPAPAASAVPAPDPGAAPVERAPAPPGRTRRSGARAWRRRAGRLLGPVALAAAIGFVLLYFDEAKTRVEAVLEPPMQTYTTRPGEIARLVLADGSKVVLDGASTLSLLPGYGRRARELRLDGGAYFEVAHDPSNAFRVHTARMTVEDRGTRFAVIAYSHDLDEQVAVVEGAVAVASRSAGAVILGAHDVASVSSDGRVRATRDIAVDRYLSWIDGTLQFDQDEVAAAARAIQRRFGIEVHVADSALARRRFTGAVRGATLYDDLRGLALLLDASYERKGRVVTLRSRRAPRRRRGARSCRRPCRTWSGRNAGGTSEAPIAEALEGLSRQAGARHDRRGRATGGRAPGLPAARRV
ncbi:MAG TPA: FecR family protein [Longimicrobiales bacterium]